MGKGRSAGIRMAGHVAWQMARVEVTHVRCMIAILYNTLLWAY